MNPRDYIENLKKIVDELDCGASLNLRVGAGSDFGWACFFTDGAEFASEDPQCLLTDKPIHAWVLVQNDHYPSTLTIRAEITERDRDKEIRIEPSKLEFSVASAYRKRLPPYNHRKAVLARKLKHKKPRAVLACHLSDKDLGFKFGPVPQSSSMDITVDIR